MKSVFSTIKGLLSSLQQFSSHDYWVRRYENSGTSGPGSYGPLAEFKAGVLNSFVHQHSIASVIEFGCGDGSQLSLANYPAYIGYDISQAAIDLCRTRFADDPSKQFFLLDEYDGRRASLSISLDVVFHLTEAAAFESYMHRLFDSSSRYVVIYSSNRDDQPEPRAPHVLHRKFTSWVNRHLNGHWRLFEMVANPYPYNGDYQNTSFSDFYMYEKA